MYMHTCICTHVYVRMYVCVYIYMHIYVYMYTFNTRVHIHVVFEHMRKKYVRAELISSDIKNNIIKYRGHNSIQN